MPDFAFSSTLRDRMRERLSGFERLCCPDADLRKAAVAIVVAPLPRSDRAGVLVTMRPQKLNRHGGQYALPGGRLDTGETDIEAALRELQEELGLTLDSSAVLGMLDDFPTRSGFRIAPIVLWAENLETISPDPDEVAEVHHLPFAELASPDIPRLTASEAGDEPVLSAFFPTLGHYMYAPTAAILYQFREIAIHGRNTRAAHFEQPTFAWK
jgi:8-oxo-dGTP pyrophosphatase MutT (NUDIX family)